MLILGIDSSAPTGAVALRNETEVIATHQASVDTTHSEGLMPALDAMFRQTQYTLANVTAVACVIGPGSYTGLRIGIASAQGIAMPRQLPCIPVSAFDLYANAALKAKTQTAICVPVIAARKGWVYTQKFTLNDNQATAVEEPQNIEIDELITQLQEPAILCGPGIAPYREMLSSVLQNDFVQVSTEYDAPHGDVIVNLAYDKLQQGQTVTAAELLPNYLGASQAELNWKKHNPPSGKQA